MVSPVLECPVQDVCDVLLKGVQFPHFCAKHMMEGTPIGDAKCL